MAILTTLTVQPLSGITDVAQVAAGSGGDKVQCADNIFIIFSNTSGANRTITVNRRLNCKYGVDHDSVTTIATAKTGLDGPFPIAEFDDGTGYAGISYDNNSGLTIAAVRIRG